MGTTISKKKKQNEEVQAVLTPEQKEKMKELAPRRGEGRGGAGGGRPGGPGGAGGGAKPEEKK